MRMARIPECRGILLSLPLACNRLVLAVRRVGLCLLTVIAAFLFFSSLSARRLVGQRLALVRKALSTLWV